MIKRRNLRTRSIKLLVLDEADEMLKKGKDDREPRSSKQLRFLCNDRSNFGLDNMPSSPLKNINFEFA